MSVSFHRGVAVPDHIVAEAINQSNRAAACAVLLRCISAVFEYLRFSKSTPGFHPEPELAPLLRGGGRLAYVFANLSTETSVEDLKKMLLSIPFTVDDAGGPSMAFDDLAMDVWKELLRELHPSAPLPMSTVVVRDPRLEGTELEPSVLYLIFSEEVCVSVAKTAQGNALDAAIQRPTKVSTWTSVSW